MSRLCRLKSYKNIGDDGKWAYSEITQLRQQLAESQAREARLREAMHDVAHCLRGNQRGYDHELFDDAIALPHDDTALKEYRDAVIEECANVCDHFEEKADALNDSISDDDDPNEGRSEWIMGKAEAASRIGKSLRKMKGSA